MITRILERSAHRRWCVLSISICVCALAGPGAPDAPGQWQQLQKLTAADAEVGDEMGRSVAISGDAAVVGASHDDDACPADPDCQSGSAYLFARNEGGPDNWGQVAKLTAADAASFDLFGLSVAISGGIAIVGAFDNDDAGTNSGSAYLFDVATGQQIRKLTADDAEVGDHFGISVAISGDIALVGAQFNGDRGSRTGSAYVFARNEGGPDNWGQVARLTADDGAFEDKFGRAVAIDGDIAIVGAYHDDDAGSASGSAYLFARNEGGQDNWGQVAKLTAGDAATDDELGRSVSLSGDLAIIGAFRDDDAGSESGSAYLFDVATGKQLHKLTAADAAEGDRFGFSVAISGDLAIVGALEDDDEGFDSGSAYVFSRNEGGPDNWGQVAKPVAPDATESDQFGFSVAISGDMAIVGANLDDDGGSASGSAYVFREIQCGFADLDDDGIVGIGDLLALFNLWGPCPGPPGCPGDLNANGTVGVGDMLIMFANWGPCP